MDSEGNNSNQNTNQGGAVPSVTSGGAQSSTQNTASASAGSDKKTLMAVLSYIGILVIIPYLVSKEDPFVHFHIKQGLVLVVIEILVWVLGMMVYMLYPFIGIIQLALVVLSIIGIVNAVQGKEKEIPLVGQFAKHFNNI